MYVIMVYDVGQKRGAKVLKFLRQHLIWVQNSVFEGEVTNVQFEEIKHGIKERIKKEEDCIIYYKFDSMNYTDRGIIGKEKNEIDSFI
ncbi:MAG: CRISPR-associated endonuclease Cas2 [Melioribacteraceae bacterium]|nr:CRISPR-associated endonuclease Cas2 [Melioribacteraceae bacterium]